MQLTRNRGRSPRDRVAECLSVSVAGGRFDLEIERFEGFCPVVKAPFASLQHPPEVALRLPTANGLDPSGIAVRDAARAGQPSKSVLQALLPRIGKIGPIGQEPGERLYARSEVMCFPA